MVLSTEQRIALLAKAREAKAKKKAEADALKPVPIKGRPPKKTLDITPNVEKEMIVEDHEVEEIIKPSDEEIVEIEKIKNIGNPIKRTTKKISSEYDESEPEIIEKVEIRKIKKPKRRIVRKIIKEQYDSESTEEEYEEIVHQAPKHKSKAKVTEAPKEQTIVKEPPEIKKSTFNLFSY